VADKYPDHLRHSWDSFNFDVRLKKGDSLS